MRPAAAIAIAAAAWVAGCATDPAPSGTRYLVSAPSAALYKNGPAQDPRFVSPQLSSLRTLADPDSGPDTRLPKGAYVTLLRREIGYSRVVTDQGLVGYVANDELQKAPTAVSKASAVPQPPGKQYPLPRTNRPQQLHPPEDHLDLSDVPLPLPS